MSTEALVVAVISRDRSVHQLIASALEETPGADCPLWTLAEYPAPDQMAEIGRASVGCVVFLDFDVVQRAKAVAAELDLNYPRATTVAIHSANRSLDLNELMRLGIREVIELPASAGEVARFLARARRKLEQAASTAENGGGRICAFLPAKPGSGATTIALHSAAAAARLANRRTLLIDLDLQLGMTSFLLKLHGSHSVMDAMLFKDQLESVWDRLICRRELLEVLGSAPVDFEREIPAGCAASLLDFARQHYPTVCVDLPGEMRQHEIDTLHRASEIFLVCTADIGTLHLAKRKKDILEQLGVQPRVSVVLNRAQTRATVSVSQIESILELPVRFTLVAAEKEIAEATQKAEAIEGRSPFALQIENIARRMISRESKTPGEFKMRRFIEMFSVSTVRDKVSR